MKFLLKRLFQVSTLILIIQIDCSLSSYSIDDGILFRLNFQPSESAKTDESGSAVPADESLLGTKSSAESLLGTKSSDDFETVLISTGRNEQYHCSLPKSDTKAGQDRESYSGPHALSILEKLFVSQACAYRLEHYWTYELCHGRFLRQFHEERDGKKIKVTEYFLGRYTKEQFNSESSALKASIEQGSVRKPPKKKIETMNLPYYELEMNGGTVCDLTGLPRTARVHYVCYPNGKHEIYSFRESSSCEYEVIVLSNIICNHPDYRPEESNEQVINCQPANEKTSRKPFDLISMETEALKFRSNKMYEAQLFQGDKGPGSVKIEIKPFNPSAGTAAGSSNKAVDPEDDEDVKYRNENWKETLRREPFKPLMDPEVVKEFLLGQYCLHGGTGWWKYEFCYGKSVDQYHEEKNGQKTLINLGRFDQAKHLDWIEKNPSKRPKPRDHRKHVSHFYSGGDLCDLTGNPRQVEVKLKCKPSESPSAVSLYLLEPKTCEYILGIESPLVCDILPLADDHHGLMDVTIDQFHEHHEQDRADSASDVSSEDDKSQFVAPPMVKFGEEDAVKSPFGDDKNVPFTDDSIIIITDYQAGDDDHLAQDYEDYEDEHREEEHKIPEL